MTLLTAACRRVLVAVMLVTIVPSVRAIAQGAASPPPAGTPQQGQPPSTPPGGAGAGGGNKPKTDLKASVTILGAAAANDAVSTAVESGTTVPLKLYVKEPPAERASAVLRVSPFTSQAQPTVVAIARIQVIGTGAAAAESVVFSQLGTTSAPGGRTDAALK